MARVTLLPSKATIIIDLKAKYGGRHLAEAEGLGKTLPVFGNLFPRPSADPIVPYVGLGGCACFAWVRVGRRFELNSGGERQTGKAQGSRRRRVEGPPCWHLVRRWRIDIRPSLGNHSGMDRQHISVARHRSAPHFSASGLFSALTSFAELEQRISDRLPTPQERGDAFEVFAEAYLATQKIRRWHAA